MKISKKDRYVPVFTRLSRTGKGGPNNNPYALYRIGLMPVGCDNKDDIIYGSCFSRAVEEALKQVEVSISDYEVTNYEDKDGYEHEGINILAFEVHDITRGKLNDETKKVKPKANKNVDDEIPF